MANKEFSHLDNPPVRRAITMTPLERAKDIQAKIADLNEAIQHAAWDDLVVLLSFQRQPGETHAINPTINASITQRI